MTVSEKPSLTSQTIRLSILPASVVFTDFIRSLPLELRCRDLVLFLCETPYLGREKTMATHSSTLAWKIPWTEEPHRLQSMGSQRVRHN